MMYRSSGGFLCKVLLVFIFYGDKEFGVVRFRKLCRFIKFMDLGLDLLSECI